MCFLPSSLTTGYRHVYLEGLTEASIFVHVAVHDVYGKVSTVKSGFCSPLICGIIYGSEKSQSIKDVVLDTFVFLVEPSSPEPQLYNNALSRI